MQKALEPTLGLRITADEIEAAWKEAALIQRRIEQRLFYWLRLRP